LPAYQPERLSRETRLARDHRTIQAEKTADRLKRRPFSTLKTSQMFTRDHDLISSGSGLPKICIHHYCVQPLFLNRRKIDGCQLAFGHGWL
jgi:hypothetical protein